MSGPHVINLVARTLGGSEYPISVDDKLSVAELKEVIAAQASDFTASTMRLLKGMNALDDYDSLAAVRKRFCCLLGPLYINFHSESGRTC